MLSAEGPNGLGGWGMVGADTGHTTFHWAKSDATCTRPVLDHAASGVDAAANRRTSRAPIMRRTDAAERSVEPVVTTSSTRSTRGGACHLPAKPGPLSRSVRVRPVCGPVSGSRRNRPRHGTPSRRATALARSSAWSYPRTRLRTALVGAHVTTSAQHGSTKSDMPSASRAITARPLPYFSPLNKRAPSPENASSAGTGPGGAGSSESQQPSHGAGPGRLQSGQTRARNMNTVLQEGCYEVAECRLQQVVVGCDPLIGHVVVILGNRPDVSLRRTADIVNGLGRALTSICERSSRDRG
jgi:hypothetical protein